MFGNAPRALWQKWITPDEIGRIPLQCRSLLIEYKEHKILCETGIGAFFSPDMASRFGVETPETHQLIESLKTLDLTPEDITHVVLSHLHFDHAGGLLTPYKEGEAPELLFSNADFFVGQEAYERSLKPHRRDKASFIPALPQLLQDSGRLQILEEGTRLFDDRMSFFTSHGHTPGQMLVRFKGDTEEVFFCGDLIPGEHWVHLPITMGYDCYPEKLIDEKERLYNSQDLESTFFFFTHDWQWAWSKVQRNEKGKFIPFEKEASLQRKALN